jgi:activator of 2-hydroxyglutaryl-CoA dehydratase
MVAAKAVSLLRQLSPEVPFPLVVSGGVAQNSGVVRAIREAVGGPAVVPAQPQLIGALGAALIARDGA